MSRNTLVLGALLSCASVSHAAFTTFDFETDDSGAVLVNGQDIMSPDEFGSFASVSSSGGNAGAAIFDSDPMGPNAGGPDPDLLVGLGNILILQNGGSATQSTPGIFDTPNDASNGGAITFDITSPTELLSIDLIDVDGGNTMELTLTDSAGLVRTYSVGNSWTNDVTDMPAGFDTLDLSTLSDQLGEGGGIATATEDQGFDPSSVVRLRVGINGSGGIDNLTFVPTPGAAALMGLAGIATMRRRR